MGRSRSSPSRSIPTGAEISACCWNGRRGDKMQVVSVFESDVRISGEFTMRLMAGRRILALSLFSILMLGCGDGRETHFDEGTIVPTHTQNVRSWLSGVAQTGQLDSGASIMRDEIAAMKEEGVSNTDTLLADFDALVKSSSAPAIRAKATEMLGKLPADAPAAAPAG